VPSKPAWYYRQSAAIPVRRSADGVQVLLVTSRSGKRWIVPKGIVEKQLTPAESAAKEAWEEAGVRGALLPGPIGSYRYEKWGGTCTVEVFVLRVEEWADQWPEPERRRRWAGLEEAAGEVREPDLAALVRTVAALLAEEEAADEDADAGAARQVELERGGSRRP
jgi:phosphohistidine phosphatase